MRASAHSPPPLLTRPFPLNSLPGPKLQRVLTHHRSWPGLDPTSPGRPRRVSRLSYGRHTIPLHGHRPPLACVARMGAVLHLSPGRRAAPLPRAPRVAGLCTTTETICQNARFFSRVGSKCTPLLQKGAGYCSLRPTLEILLYGREVASAAPKNEAHF